MGREDRCSDRYSKSQYRIATVPREYLYSTGYETVPDPRPVLARYSAKMYPQLAEIHFSKLTGGHPVPEAIHQEVHNNRFIGSKLVL